MIPILYEKDETAFAGNGLGRLRDCITCTVTEERNGIYECDFEYPINGQHFDDIRIGRIITVEHDDTGDVQPFDIVGYTEPIDGIVTFHCTHVSYRQSKITVNGTNITTLANAFSRLKNNSTPSNPFTYETDKTSSGYVAAFDGVPKSVRSILGGVEGSILDTFGGEYEWNGFRVILHNARGQYRDFTIRYGVNMTDYTDETDASECYSSVIPYWTDGTTTIVGDKQTSGGLPPSGREECVPLDVSEKFETDDDTLPTKAQINAMGRSMINSSQPFIPAQNITVSFVRLQDAGEFAQFTNLLKCQLCDTISVVFPRYNSSGRFKIVKVVWDVLEERYEEMELGDLSVSLSEALGINDIQQNSNTFKSMLNTFYPVGSYYETSDTTFNPNDAWGGTWELEAEGLVHIGSGSNYAVGATGGEKTHTLTENEMPSHNHKGIEWLGDSSYPMSLNTGSNSSGYKLNWEPTADNNKITTVAAGGGQAHNNMQPYIVVNRWHRTA